ncbi:MAG: septum formation initiator family protein [Patescibacteria group bacterium]|nr:septum formation initiator family protein [Patescibacteria group bacterium]
MKKVVFFTVLIVSIFIIKNFASSIYGLWQKQDLIVQAKSELENEKKKNQGLKNKMSYADSPGFVEEEARNKLFMSKPGEAQVVLPQGVGEAIDSSTGQYQKTIPNWKKWIELFFK